MPEGQADEWSSISEASRPYHDDLHDVSLSDEPKDTEASSIIRMRHGSRPPYLRNLFHECVFVALIALAAATPVFLQRSTYVVTASIGQALRMTPAQLAWATAGSGLTTGVFLLPFGHISDAFPGAPRKICLVVSLVAFALLVALTSFSQSGIVLDVMSTLSGIACAANIPIAVGLLSLMYPFSSRRKNIVFSSFLMGTPAATIIGGLGSGALSMKLSWRAPFISIAALFAAIALLSWFLVPNVADPRTEDMKGELQYAMEMDPLQPRTRTILLRFDWIGLVIIFSGLILFTVALTIGPEGPEPWKTPTVILLLTLGLLLLGCFVLWETRTEIPLIPPTVWKDWSIPLIVLCTLFSAMAFHSQVFWVSLLMQQLYGLSSLAVAIRLLPQAVVGLFISPLVGLTMHKVSGTVLLAVACAFLAISNVLLILAKPTESYFTWIFPSLILSIIGMDWTVNVGSLHILSSLPVHQHSTGASLIQAVVRIAVPIGMAVTTSVWSSYDDSSNLMRLQLAYSNTFLTTTAMSGAALLLVPFIRIGKQGLLSESFAESNDGEDHKPCPSASNLVDNAANKRWSFGETASHTSSSPVEKRPTPAPSNVSSSMSKIDTPRTSTRSTIRSPIVWTVCEDCGTRRRSTADATLGDPNRYFNDPAGASAPGDEEPALLRPYGRRRFPLVNRQIMTHQMLTQGFQV